LFLIDYGQDKLDNIKFAWTQAMELEAPMPRFEII